MTSIESPSCPGGRAGGWSALGTPVFRAEHAAVVPGARRAVGQTEPVAGVEAQPPEPGRRRCIESISEEWQGIGVAVRSREPGGGEDRIEGRRGRTVIFDDKAPLAGIRDAILTGQ